MIVIGREFLSYDKDNIKYYINFPRLYNDKDFIKDEMTEFINEIIFEDIVIFLEIVEDSYSNVDENNIMINSLTEFEVGFQSEDIVSIAIEYTQLSGFLDISYLKGYNYDFSLKKEIKLKDLFKKEVEFEEILKNYISEQIVKIIREITNPKEYGLDENIVDNIYIDENSIFYFDSEYLILPFSSCELSQNIMNLVEFKIPFNRIYSYLSEYAMKNLIKSVIF